MFLCSALLPVKAVAAVDESMSFVLELTADGRKAAVVEVGGEISFEVELRRTDSDRNGHYTLYSMQDEITFDSNYFTFVEGSQTVPGGFDFNIRTLEDGHRKRIIISRLVMSPLGASMPDEQVIAAFKLRADESIQGEVIASRRYKVNNQQAESYITTGNDVSVTVMGNDPLRYAVIFEGGADADGTAPSVGAHEAGASFELPDNTFRRNGYHFSGWHDGIQTYKAGVSYTMPARVVTFTAEWEAPPPTPVPGETTVVTTTTVKATAESSGILPSETAPTQGGPRIDLEIDSNDRADREITVEETGEGLLITGKDLSGLTFDVIKPGGKGRVRLDTEEKKVLVKEVDKDVIEVFVDQDGDGRFETSIGRFTIKGNRAIPLVIGAVVVLAVLGAFLIYVRKRSPKQD